MKRSFNSENLAKMAVSTGWAQLLAGVSPPLAHLVGLGQLSSPRGTGEPQTMETACEASL